MPWSREPAPANLMIYCAWPEQSRVVAATGLPQSSERRVVPLDVFVNGRW